MIAIRGLVDRALTLAIRAFAQKRVVEGMPVYLLTSRLTREAALPTLVAAIQLLAQHDPRRWRRICADVPAVVLWPLRRDTAGALNATTRWCLVSAETVASDRAGLATVLILAHEGLHARLLRSRIPHEGDWKPRHERACTRAEWHAAQRMPNFTNKPALLRDLEQRVYAAPRRPTA